ncbi:MAG: Uncharacterised protein [Cyanobium sp. ARS6]|nr:MAG: Uncharacterised protein [Cyanobium sp. ARS6]
MAFFLHETGGKDSSCLVRGALQVKTNGQELTHDVEPLLRQQVEHHGNVVSQEDLAVIESFVVARMFQGGDAASQVTTQRNQCSLEVFSRLLDHLVFLRARSNTLVLLAEASCHVPLRIAKT